MEEADLIPRPGNVRHEWHWVRPVLEELLADNPDCGTIPEDVYHEVKSGSAHLWVMPVGLVITQFEFDVHSGEKMLFIWFAWSRERGSGVGAPVMNHLEQFAKANQCKSITFGTRYQPLIDRLCRDMGFRVSTQILTKEVE